MRKRILSIVLASVILLMMIPVSTLVANATQSHIEGFLTSYALTGDGATDMVAIALAQAGRTGSQFGYTEEWCADFVGDCAKLAGQSAAVPLYGACQGLYERIMNAGGVVTTNSPQPGDICFINWDGGTSKQHVEIVYNVSGSSVYTIGGNSGTGSSLYSRSVYKHTFTIGSSLIVKIVRPNYSTNEQMYSNLGDDFYAYIYHEASGFGLCNVNSNVELGEYGTTSALWRFVRQTDGSYEIISGVDGKVMDVADAATANGTNIQAYAPNGTIAQRWYIKESGSGYALIAANSRKAVDIYNGYTDYGTNAQLYAANDSAAQTFQIVPVSTPLLAVSTNRVDLSLDEGESKTITVTAHGDFPNGISMWWYGNGYASCAWGDWNGNHAIPLTITAESMGEGPLSITLFDAVTEEELAWTSVYTNVTGTGYTVRYDGNGGSYVPETQFKAPGEGIYLSSTVPSKFGYTFLGWRDSTNGVTYYPGDFYAADESVTLTASWGYYGLNHYNLDSAVSNSIDFANQEVFYSFTPYWTGEHCIESYGNADTQVYLYSEDGSLLQYDDDSGENLNFKLYYTLDAGTKYYIKTRMYSNNVGSFAFKLTGDKYLVSYISHDGTTHQVKEPGVPLRLSDLVPSRFGYTFHGWYNGADNSYYYPGQDYTADENIILQASWSQYELDPYDAVFMNSCNIEFPYQEYYYDYTPEMTVECCLESYGNMDTVVELYDSTGQLLATNDDGGEGYNFKLYYTLASRNSYYIKVRLYSNNVGSFSFNITGVRHLISYDANGGTGAPDSTAKVREVSLTIPNTVPSRFGYRFLGWSDVPTATAPKFLPGDIYDENASITFYAVWEPVEEVVMTNNFVQIQDDITYPNEELWYRFTPDSSQRYSIWSRNTADDRVYLYDAAGNLLASDDDSGEGNAFYLYHHLDAGNTYYIKVRMFSSNITLEDFTFQISKNVELSYDCNGGTGGPVSENGPAGIFFIISNEIPVREGYTFLFWGDHVNANVYYPGDLCYMGQDLTLIAYWERSAYTVSFDANGGTDAPASQTKTVNVPLMLSTQRPTRTGYTFLGWARSVTATSAEYQPGSRFAEDADTTLYAVWQLGCEIAHDYSYSVTQEPAVEENGYLAGICKDCGATTIKPLAALSTTYYSYNEIASATCTEAGVGRYTWNNTTYGNFYFDVTISELGHNYTAVVTAPSCTEQGYTTHTCSRCGVSYVDTYMDSLGHSYIDGTCTVCGKENTGEDFFFDLAGANMALGNSLSMNLYVNASDVTEGDYYMEIVKTYADGRADAVKTVPMSQWGSYSGMYYVTFDGVAAKEMTDDFYVTVYHADGTQASNTKVISIADYAISMLNRTDSTSAASHNLMADMLNYGAAAQQSLKYGLNDLANAKMTAAHKACATRNFSMDQFSNNTVKGTGFMGANLSLESSICMNVFFDSAIVDKTMTARVSYTNHSNKKVTYQIPGSEFFVLSGYGFYGVEIDTMVAADAESMVTVEILDGGKVVASGSTSVESLAFNGYASVPLYVDLMKFCTAAYNFFH